jgi:predicted AlkP superfamily phosphohydrolase/phosphomutase
MARALLPLAAQQRLAAGAFRDSLDWPRTRAFTVPTWDSGLIRVNLQGREAAGVVAPADLPTVLVDVERLVRETLDADTGRPLATDVLRPQELWPGTRSAGLPDLLVTWAGARPARRASHPRLGVWEAESKPDLWTEHHGQVLVVLSGPGVRVHPDVVPADPAGLAATLLALSGARRPSVMPVPAWTDVLEGADVA